MTHLKHFEKLQLHEVTTILLQAWFNALLGKMSKSTRAGLKAILHGIFARAIEWKLYVDMNPVTPVKVFGEDDSREKVKLSDAHTRQFLAALQWDIRLLCMVCLFCGLRFLKRSR
jgi:hypothetical protein